jgi:hypothetical protein
MNNIIYFNQDSKVHAKEYAQFRNKQDLADKVGSTIEKVAIGSCVFVSIVAVAILVFVLCA